MRSSSRTALIVGASGLVGENFLEHLAVAGDWEILTLSRRPVKDARIAGHVSLDLLDPEACKSEANKMAGVTHVFYLSRFVQAGYSISVEPNVLMLKNLMDALEPLATGLRHVQVVHGCKWYGVHVGPFRTPAREADPRPDIPLYYFEQHDFLSARQIGKTWTWSTLRPHFIYGMGIGSPSNVIGVVGVYAAILRELGMPLVFPGSEAAYNAVVMPADVKLVAEAMSWAATTPACGNEDFNVANGDFMRWREVWPRVAAFYGIQPGPPRPFSIAEFMKDKAEVWDRVQARFDLRRTPFEQVADWAFADSVFRLEWDQAISIVKLHSFGFPSMIDSENRILDLLAEHRQLKLLP